ncbi:MAG: imidazolonepropionase [Calditrichia bacterium]
MKNSKLKLIGPFAQLLPLAGLPLKGTLADEQLDVISNAGVVVTGGTIQGVGDFEDLYSVADEERYIIEKLDNPGVALPGFVDCHTHICWGGNRARDYAMRVAGKSYLDIAKAGGGILDSVAKTRASSLEELVNSMSVRAARHFAEGVTTCEVKSGYGLSVDEELKMLRAIQTANNDSSADLVATCLAAHMPPAEYKKNPSAYLEILLTELLPKIKAAGLSDRVDIFVEESAFNNEQARNYLTRARQMGFSLVMHVDQFTAGGSLLACELEAVSADHLEASTDREIAALASSKVIAVALPGASLGLGCAYTPARKLLDGGAALAIATDWNPGSAPMGDLLMQAAVLGAHEKLTTAETFAGITFRAAAALELSDRGSLAAGKLADIVVFPTDDHRDILYHQGKMKPVYIWKNGIRKGQNV